MTIKVLQSNVVLFLAVILGFFVTNSTALSQERSNTVRAAVPAGKISHILVIDLENKRFDVTFAANSPATYLNSVLLKQGELVVNYFGTSHNSLGNYITQISGQAQTVAITNNCGIFTNIFPGTVSGDKVNFPSQIIGDGCVFPGASKTSKGALTIADQLDKQYKGNKYGNAEAKLRTPKPVHLNWRGYMEDMGINTARDYGTSSPPVSTTCAHPPLGGKDFAQGAAPEDQYATRHNPFMYFHSIIDDQVRCDTHVVPLGKLSVGTNGAQDSFSGSLYNDLRSEKRTPNFMLITPNLCNDGHDDPCVAPNVEGTKDSAGNNAGGLVAADLWLKHWMPMIFNSPAYKNGSMLVVLTFDESVGDARACEKPNQADCKPPISVNLTNPGYKPSPGQTPPTTPFDYPGGGQVGAVLFNKRFIKPGSINTTGSYNHYSALRSYEDLLGITKGGDDRKGHIGFAAWPTMKPFGRDVFNRR